MLHFLFPLLLVCSFMTKDALHVQLQWHPSREIAHEDEQQMKELFLRCFLQTYRLSGVRSDQSDQEIQEFLASDFDAIVHPYLHELPQKQLLEAKIGNRLIGYALFEQLQEDTVYIAELAVLPEFQRQGLGRKMTFFPCEQDSKIRKMVLLTEIGNKPARGFYESLGFLPSNYTHEGYSADLYCAYEKSL